ncbi:hypothetical protein [Immundisolibacter sp.]
MIMYEDIPAKLENKINTWTNAKSKWLARAEEAFGYFFNDIEDTATTYTQNQVDRIKATTNIPVSINLLYPVLSQKHAILSQTKPSHKVVSLSDNEQAKQAAFILDKAKHSILYNSEALVHNEESIKSYLISGIGHVGLLPKDFISEGEFGLSYQHLPIWNITVDPNSRLKTNEDMQGYIYAKELGEDVILKLYQPYIETIKDYYGITVSIDDLLASTITTGVPRHIQLESLINERRGLVRKFYDKAVAEMYYVENPETGEIERLFRENMFPEQQVIIDTGKVIKSSVNYYVRETTIVGKKILNIEMLPINMFPMKTQYFEWGGKPYRSYGMIHFTKGMQEAMDKTIQQLILNAMLSNNAGWTAPKGSIAEEDAAKWRIDGNNPMAIKEYVPRVYEGGVVLKPERDQILPLAAHYPQIMDMMKQGIEYSTGINPMIQGDPRGAKVDVFSSLQQYQSAAMQRINLAAQHINQVQEYIGRVLVQWLPSMLKTNQYYTFFDQQGKFDEIKITKEVIQSLEVNNFTVAAVPAESSPTYRMSMATEMMKIAQTTPDPQERNIYIKKGFALSDIRGFDEMQDELNEVQKLNQQIQQMQQQIESDKEVIDQFRNQALRSEFIAEKTRMILKAHTDVNVAATEAVKDIEIEKLQEQLEEAKKPTNGSQ